MQKLLRLLLEPISYGIRDFVFSNIKTILFTFVGAFSTTLILSRATNLLLEKRGDEYFFLLWAILAGLGIYMLLVIFLRFEGMPRWKPIFWKYLHNKYLPLVCELDNNYVDSIGSARIYSLIDKGGQAWFSLINNIFEQTIRLLMMFIPLCFLLFTQSFIFIGGTFVLIGAIFGFVYLFGKKLSEQRKQRTVFSTEYDRHFLGSLISRNELVSNSGIKNSLQRLDTGIDLFGEKFIQVHASTTVIFQTVKVFVYCFLIFVLWILYGFFLEETVSLQSYLLITGLIGGLTSIIFDVINLYLNSADQFASITALFERVDFAPRMPNLFVGLPYISSQNGDIQINSISFGYKNSEMIFQDFSYTFQSKKVYALVGSSGGGKSTLMKLASGFLFPQSGTVSIAGNDIKTVQLSELYPHISYLPQDPYLFDGSIRENLLSGLGDISESQIHEAITQAQAEFIFQFPDGIETQVGERGVRLSGGQKQRLAIAKVFLKRSDYIFLDEPTSALDSLSEELLTRSFVNLFQNRTVIISAHRLKTVESVDCILVLDQGKIVEQGSHAELLQQGGAYTRMMKAQAHF